jgi:hypothetical protein
VVTLLRPHPLQGAIFENLIVTEFRKLYLHGVRHPPPHFWRDTNGVDVDLVVDLGTKRVPVEIKAGLTVYADFFKHLERYPKLSRDPYGIVVYGGDEPGRRHDHQIRPWWNCAYARVCRDPPEPAQDQMLIHEEAFKLTDEEALEQLEFNLLWRPALGLTAEEAHLCPKTLYNSRARLLTKDPARLVFEETTDRIIAALGSMIERQRLDSTHIANDIALLTRLGLFCDADAKANVDLDDENRVLTTADFTIDVSGRRAAVCPVGHESVQVIKLDGRSNRLEIVFGSGGVRVTVGSKPDG